MPLAPNDYSEAQRTGVRRLHAEVSLTARSFFERHGFIPIRENVVELRGESMPNYLMECFLASPPGA